MPFCLHAAMHKLMAADVGAATATSNTSNNSYRSSSHAPAAAAATGCHGIYPCPISSSGSSRWIAAAAISHYARSTAVPTGAVTAAAPYAPAAATASAVVADWCNSCSFMLTQSVTFMQCHGPQPQLPAMLCTSEILCALAHCVYVDLHALLLIDCSAALNLCHYLLNNNTQHLLRNVTQV